MKIALAGNPNSGKTSLFNILTRSSAHVGNWPGVTVEKREGVYKNKKDKTTHTIVDLPGIYSITPYTQEEIVTRKFLLEEKPDVIINIVDSTNLERNLYLTTQLLEIDCKIVIALNMTDIIEKNGGQIDINALSQKLGLSTVPISALKKKGIKELMQEVEKAHIDNVKREATSVLSSTNLKNSIDDLKIKLYENNQDNSLFRAIKIIEGDSIERDNNKEIALEFDKQIEPKLANFGGDLEEFIADNRYTYITENYSQFINYDKEKASQKSHKADKILTHRIWGIPIFLAIMFAIFHITFSENFLGLSVFGIDGIPSLGVFIQGLLEQLMELISTGLSNALASSPDWASGLVVDGVFAGLSAVLSFLPQILLLFLFLSILEDTGYMARVAFIMDRAFRRFGLSGRAFMPLLMCFGCAVPGVMATRTLASERERKIAILLAPFFSCGAKLPIWAVVTSVVFPAHADVAVLGVYLIGIITAVLAAFILSKFFIKGEMPPFLLELPDYRAPKIGNTFKQLWDKLKDYLFKAATIIAGATVVIWFLSNFSFRFQMVDASSKDSMLGLIGNALRPIFVPLGFASGDEGWMFVVAILTGLIAKEMVVATLGVLSGAGDGVLDLDTGDVAQTSLGTLLATLSGPAAISFMAFNLLSVPCMAAVAAVRAEFKSAKATFLAIVFWLVTAYIVSLVLYWTGMMFVKNDPVGVTVFVLSIALVAFTIGYNVIRYKKRKRLGCCGGGCSSCSGCSSSSLDVTNSEVSVTKDNKKE